MSWEGTRAGGGAPAPRTRCRATVLAAGDPLAAGVVLPLALAEVGVEPDGGRPERRQARHGSPVQIRRAEHRRAVVLPVPAGEARRAQLSGADLVDRLRRSHGR